MSKNPNNINLDQLLDLKRAEKPADDFWDGFQKEFRQRQLQTLIEKESGWKQTVRMLFARSSLLVPISGVAIALFVLTLSFKEEDPLHKGYFEAADLVQSDSQPSAVEASQEVSNITPVLEEVQATPVDLFPAAASFVMDSIHNEEPEPLNYTRAFPTSTIPAEKRAVGALVSYTIARDNPSFGFSARPQTIGF